MGLEGDWRAIQAGAAEKVPSPTTVTPEGVEVLVGGGGWGASFTSLSHSCSKKKAALENGPSHHVESSPSLFCPSCEGD